MVSLSSPKTDGKGESFVHETNALMQLNERGPCEQSCNEDKQTVNFIGNKSMHESEQCSSGTRVGSIFRTVTLKICSLLPCGSLSGQILK